MKEYAVYDKKNRDLAGRLRHHLLKAPDVFTLKGQRRHQERYNKPATHQMCFVRTEMSTQCNKETSCIRKNSCPLTY
jgi:hypothetical protein